jgi:hypothetical protein
METTTTQRVSDVELVHFKAIPWCKEHLKAGNLIFLAHPSRELHRRGKNAKRIFRFWGVTLATQEAIPHFLAFYSPPSSDPPQPPNLAFWPLVSNISFLLTLGPDLSTHEPIACGGAMAAIFDDCICALVFINGLHGLLPQGLRTSTLSVTLLKAVPLEATVLVRVSLKEVEGPRLAIVAELSSERGSVLARAEAVVVSGRRESL